MQGRFQGLGPVRWVIAIVAAGIIIFTWQQTLYAGRGLVSRDLTGESGTPLRFFAPEGADGIPGVIVAHGFAGSRQLMYGFGNALARAGYGVMLLDFDGHGAARGRLDPGGSALQRNLDTAYQALIAQPDIDPARIALLGHSMGSGAVMTAAIDSVDHYQATVAVSPTSAAVSAESPRNLLLMAGSLEPQFLANAWELLAAAGGSNDDLAGGRGRAMVEVPGVEHITILFSRAAHQAALDWLDRTFDRPTSVATSDRRLLLLAAHLGGWLALLLALAPVLPSGPDYAPMRRGKRSWAGLLLGVVAAAGVFYLAGFVTDAGRLGGLLVGGALGLWFLVLGLVWLAVGFRPPGLSGRDFLWGVLLFLFLTAAFGLMSHFTWLPWLLTPERLARWPVLAAAILPWQLASALAQYRASPWQRAGWWLLQSVAVVAGLGLTLVLSPGLFFIVLLLPIFPIILGVLTVAGAAIDRPWAVAAGSAFFFGWLLVAVFPMA